MILLPAIDIQNGECVRLRRGDYGTAERVAESVVGAAKRFREAGAQWIHMVDLDGAKAGRPVNSALIQKAQEESGLSVELGGGIRNRETLEFSFAHGITRAVLGSAAVQNPAFVKEAVRAYGERIAVGIDARDGKVAAEGWTQTSSVDFLEMAKRMEDLGARYLIFTDISCDGMLSGPNLAALDQLNNAVSCAVIASGGVSSVKDLVNLKALNVYGVICGRALYTRDLSLEAALAVCEKI